MLIGSPWSKGRGLPFGVGGVVMITFEHLTKPHRDERAGPTLRLIGYLTGYLGHTAVIHTFMHFERDEDKA